MAPKESALRVEVPKPEDDKPRLGRVAAIAAIGFVIGVAWPRLAGVKLVPSAPSDQQLAAGEARAPAPSGSAAAADVPAAKPAAEQAPEEEAPVAPGEDRIAVKEPRVTSCRDGEQRKASCDTPALDGVARAKLLALSGCDGAKQAQGTLSIGFELDFKANQVLEVMKGKSTTLKDETADALVACAKKEFSTISLKEIQHEHERYTVFYLVELLAPGEKPSSSADADAGSSVIGASGRATVTWEVAIIRDHPKEGEIVARILRGTRVTVTGRDGDWYRVKYDAKGGEGWVFRTAIGM